MSWSAARSGTRGGRRFLKVNPESYLPFLLVRSHKASSRFHDSDTFLFIHVFFSNNEQTVKLMHLLPRLKIHMANAYIHLQEVKNCSFNVVSRLL